MEETNNVQLRTRYEVSGRIDAFYNGGPIVISPDNNYLICLDGEEVSVVNIADKTINKKISLEDDTLSALAIHPSLPVIAVGSRSLNIHLVDYEKGEAFSTWRGSDAPSIALAFHPSGQYIASGAADGSLRLFDLSTKNLIANHRLHNNLIRGIAFHPANGNVVFSFGEDGKLVRYNLAAKDDIVVDSTTHGNTITAVSFIFPGGDASFHIPEHGVIVAAGNSNVLSISDSMSLNLVKEVPVYEAVTGAVFVTAQEASVLSQGAVDHAAVLLGGSRGVIRYVNPFTSEVSESFSNPLHKSYDGKKDAAADMPSYTFMTRHQNSLLCASSAQNIYINSLIEHTSDMFSGNPGEYSAICSTDDIIATADSSGYIRVIKRNSKETMLLSGHHGIVMSIFISDEYIVSGARDNMIALWSLDGELLHTFEGHTSPVTAVALRGDLIISGSEDNTIKIWSIETQECINTIIAHEKGVTALALAPKGNMFASASQDRTIKLWDDVTVKQPRMTLRGHRKQVWCLAFSAFDKLLASGSTDGTVKIWSVKSGAVMRSLEGSAGTILGVNFITRGTQLVSACADGSISLWNMKTSESVGRFEEHSDKIWGLSVMKDGDELISVDASASLVFWRDSTEEFKQKAFEEEQEKAEEEQEISNSLRNEEYAKALALALKRNHGRKARQIVETIAAKKHELAVDYLISIIKEIPRSENTLLNLVEFIIQWNTSPRSCYAAQLAMNALFKSLPLDYLSTNIPGGSGKYTALYAYTQRHLDRIERIETASKIAELAYFASSIKIEESRDEGLKIVADQLLEADFSEESESSENEDEKVADRLKMLLEASKKRKE